MNENKYKQGERIYFSIGEGLPSGYAKIAGCQGLIYIIEMEGPIKNYPYTHIYVVDNQIVQPPITLEEGA